MKKPKRLFKRGQRVTFRVWCDSVVVGSRWVDLGRGEGVWKYKLADGRESTGFGLTLSPLGACPKT